MLKILKTVFEIGEFYFKFFLNYGIFLANNVKFLKNFE